MSVMADEIKKKDNKKGGQRKTFDAKLLTNIKLDALRDALISRKSKNVEDALKEFEEALKEYRPPNESNNTDENDEHDKIIRKTERKCLILKQREELLKFCYPNDPIYSGCEDEETDDPVENPFNPESLKKRSKEKPGKLKPDKAAILGKIAEIEDKRNPLNPELKREAYIELFQAKILLDLLDEQKQIQAKHQRKAQTLELNGKALSEIRRYPNPPALLHRIVKGALLLLGEDEEKTEDWKYCQHLCSPHGPQAINRRLPKFKPEKIHPEIVTRATEILNGTSAEEIERLTLIGQLEQDSDGKLLIAKTLVRKPRDLEGYYNDPEFGHVYVRRYEKNSPPQNANRRPSPRNFQIDRRLLYPELDLQKVETIGAGTGFAFYVWAMHVIDKAEEKFKGKKVIPANIKRQKEIFVNQRTGRKKVLSDDSKKDEEWALDGLTHPEKEAQDAELLQPKFEEYLTSDSLE